MLPDAKIPEGPMAQKWDNHKFSVKLVNPNNKRKFNILVVGSGLAGASAASTLGEDHVLVLEDAGPGHDFGVDTPRG